MDNDAIFGSVENSADGVDDVSIDGSVENWTDGVDDLMDGVLEAAEFLFNANISSRRFFFSSS